MKLQVLVRSASWLESAGTRIRYRRLQRAFKACEWLLSVDPIGSISDGLALDADIYLISKCHDAGALMTADMLREAGALVGFDLFDDYVSGEGSLTFGHRDFLRQLVGSVDFFLCSTDRMAEVVRSFAPQVPVHVLNDPHGSFDALQLAKSIEAKRLKAAATRTIEMVWFGQGHNPIFPVGLSDLAGFGSELEVFARAGWKARLTVLSNPEALDEGVLGSLQSLPFPVAIDTWSELGEATALRRALVAYLPVNHQNFSIAKSLNRAVSALTGGAQVLGTGFPLYAQLDPLIYRSAHTLAEDLDNGRLRLDQGSIATLSARLSAIANPAHEAQALIAFLQGLEPLPAVPVEDRAMRAIVHGYVSTGQIHRICKSLGWLSLGCPFTQSNLPFHAEIGQFASDGGLEIRVSREGHARLGDRWRQIAQPLPRSQSDSYTHRVPMPASAAGTLLEGSIPAMWTSRAARILAGPDLMRAAVAVYDEIFPGTKFLVSEMEYPQFGREPDVKGRE